MAESADAVLVTRDQAAAADQSLREALGRAGRDRADVALIGRLPVASGTAPGEIAGWVADARLDAVDLVATGPAEQISETLRALAPLLPGRAPGATLRAALGLREVAGALA